MSTQRVMLLRVLLQVDRRLNSACSEPIRAGNWSSLIHTVPQPARSIRLSNC